MSKQRPQTPQRPCVLVVEDEPTTREMVSEIVGREIDCQLLSAPDLKQANAILQTQRIDLLMADLHLPDGDGMSLVNALHQSSPTAASIVITGQPSVDSTLTALRAGVSDLLPKPFNAQHLVERVRKTLARQSLARRTEDRLDKLKRAVRRLSASRKTISRKVDLLCNDLVTAYGELSRQLDVVRVQENFSKLLRQAQDLEQMLCHVMDWLLRHCGYSNVAIWLSSQQGEFELGAYMKYTIQGSRALTEPMKLGLLPLTTRHGFLHLSAEEVQKKLTTPEIQQLKGQTVLSANCAYLGEPLAVLMMFRDEERPFDEQTEQTLRGIAPIFATALAQVVRGSNGELEPDDTDLFDAPPSDDARTRDSDWWKRGEPPPF